MIYLTTGANGSSKTLLTLYDVRQQQLKENRPVFYHGFEAVKEVLEGQFGWKPHDPALWNSGEDKGGVPDGAILLWDEAQTYLGARLWGTKQVPQWVTDLGVYRRKRGIDIWITCPHPSMIHVEVRRLIASPSWHRHLKRVFGSDASSETTFDAPNIKCEEPGAADGGQSRIRPFPKEVYKWYVSASLHTGKRKLPKAVYVLAVVALVIPVLAYSTYRMLSGSVEKRQASIAGEKAQSLSPGASHLGAVAGGPVTAAKTAMQYVDERRPRIPAFPHTAAVYDAVTQPQDAPYPAACVEGKRVGDSAASCRCYSQQGTVLPVPVDVCGQIVRNGFFVDWKTAEAPRAAVVPAAVPVQPIPAPAPQQQARPVLVASQQGAVMPSQGAVAHFPAVDAAVAPEPAQERHDGSMLRAMRSGDRAMVR